MARTTKSKKSTSRLPKIDLSSQRARIVLPVIAILLFGAVGFKLLSSSNAATCTSYQYHLGNTGACVGYIQNMINTYNYSSGRATISVDKSFGPITDKNVKYFQSVAYSNYYGTTLPKLTADGYVGPKTWNKLCKATSYAEAMYNHSLSSTATINQMVLKGSAAAKSAGCTQWYSYDY